MNILFTRETSYFVLPNYRPCHVCYFLFTDEADFNTTVFEVIFPADEDVTTIAEIDAFVSIVNDDIDENEEQVFVVLFEVLEAVGVGLLTSDRNLSVCRIIDNDRKYTC